MSKNIFKNVSRILFMLFSIAAFGCFSNIAFGMEKIKISKRERLGLHELYLYTDKILPFVIQKSLLRLRASDKFFKKAVSIHSKKRSIVLKKINKNNIDDFIEYLNKFSSSIDFCVELEILNSEIFTYNEFLSNYNKDEKTSSSSREIDFKDIKLIIDKLKNKLKILSLLRMKAKNLESLESLGLPSGLIGLKLYFCKDLEKLDSSKLPKDLKVLILVGMDLIKDKDLMNLPKGLKKIHLGLNVNGECFKFLPHSLRDFSCKSVTINEEYLKDLPKSLEILDIPFRLEERIVGENQFAGLFFEHLSRNLKELNMCTLEKVEEKYLKDLPKNLKTIRLSVDYLVCRNRKNQNIISKIKEMKKGIEIKTLDGRSYPEYENDSKELWLPDMWG